MPPKRHVLLDRDGTIVYDRNYLADPQRLELLPGAVEGLRRLQVLGLGLIVVTNQSGIARGYFDAPMLGRIHDRLAEMLAAEGIRLDGIYHCPHVEADDCRCRKPRPEMVERAAADLGFAPSEAFVVGDRPGDVGLGRTVGATTILVRTGVGAETERDPACRPDYVADDLLEAAEFIARRITG